MIAWTVIAWIVVFAGILAAFLGHRPSWLRAQRYLMGSVLAALAFRMLTDRARPSPG